MAKLILTLNPSYRPSWHGPEEALRELIQNALDARDEGYTMTLRREKGKRGTVHILTEGTHLKRDKLLLGSTTKVGDSAARGCYGEGFKMAALVLTREGREVTIATGNELWQFAVERSPEFGGAEVLVCYASKRSVFHNNVDVRINGLSDEDWSAQLKRLLDVGIEGCRQSVNPVTTRMGRILMDSELRGALYVGGLYAGKLPDGTAFGYDFLPSHCRLDIDRKMASTSDLQTLMRMAIEDAAANGHMTPQEVYALCSGDSFESQAISSWAQWDLRFSGTPSPLRESILTEHRRKYGPDALAATSADRAHQASSLGLSAPYVSGTIGHLFDAKEDTRLSYWVERASTGIERVVAMSELTAEESYNLHNALVAVGMVRPDYVQTVSVVLFRSPTTQGMAHVSSGTIELGRACLAKLNTTLAVLVHEVAHLESGALDGDARHLRAIEAISSDLGAVLVERVLSARGMAYAA